MSTFRIARRLSEAAGVVEAFVGVQEEPPRPVVVKRLVMPWAQAEGFAQRYLGPDQQPPRGPGLPELYEVGVANDVTYLVQELIEGESLRHAMTALAQRKGFIAPAEGLAVVSRVAHLLSDLHARAPAVLHGDVCASTMLLTARGEVYLLDANVATAAGSTQSLGPARAEPYTLAPEQLSGEVTAATDVFRLGLVLYELALGRPLFAAADATQSLVTCQRFTGLPRDSLAQVPEPYASLLMQMLAQTPTDRPSLEEVDAVLAQAAAKAGWRTPELDIARLFARACPERVGLAATLPRDGHALELTPLGGRAAVARPDRPAVTPPGSAVVARIATRKMSRTELAAAQAPVASEEARAPDHAPDVDDEHGPRDLKLGTALLDKRALTKAQLDEALEQVNIYGGSLSDALLALGTVDEDAIVTALAELTKTPAMTAKKLKEMAPHADALKLVPVDLARALDLVPLALKGGTQLVVAMKNPMDANALERLKAAAGLKSIVAMRGGERAIRTTRNRFYTGTEEDDVGEWLERGSSPSALLPGRGTAAAALVSSASGIFEGAPLPPVPSGPPRVVGQLLEAPALLAAADDTETVTALRVVEALLAMLGDRGRQGWQLVTVTVALAERLHVVDPQLRHLKLAAAALVAASLRDGRPPWDVPTVESLSAVLGPGWSDLEPLVSPLLSFPADIPSQPERLALCASFAFAMHVGQAKALPTVAGPALTSFKARFRFPASTVSALAQVLGVIPS